MSLGTSKKAGLAGFLSALWPGLGQLYNRQWAKGAGFLLGASVVDIGFGVSEEFFKSFQALQFVIQPQDPGRFFIGTVLFFVIAIWSVTDAARTAKTVSI